MPEGSVELFQRHEGAGAWTSIAILVASDGDLYDEFGCSVAVDGETVVVGATHHGQLGAKGAAYVFERQTDGAWIETAKLLPPDHAWAFGWSVDVDGDRIAVGAKAASALDGGKGMAVLFEREAGAWVQKAKLQPSSLPGGDGFGASLDLEGERIVVGAPFAWTSSSPYEGLAFVYERNLTGTFWGLKATLSPPDLQDNDQFGRDVALDGDRIVVGAPVYDQPTPYVGTAFVFDRIDGVWTQTAKLTPSDQPALTYFGWSVDVHGSRAVVGARSDSDVAASAGSVDLFEQGSSGWKEVQELHGSEQVAGDGLGYVLDLHGSEVLVGAPFLWAELGHPGSAHLFTLDPSGPSLLADATEVSLSEGGSQTLQLGACPAHAGDLYALAGSATGTRPGFALAGVPVPLNLDAYFRFTVLHPGPPLASSIGVLDAYGRADAAFTLAPGTLPALAGLVLHHAYAVLDFASLSIESVSDAVPVALVP